MTVDWKSWDRIANDLVSDEGDYAYFAAFEKIMDDAAANDKNMEWWDHLDTLERASLFNTVAVLRNYAEDGQLVAGGSDDKNLGLYRKYSVKRLNDQEGKHDSCFYYVLDLEHDPHSIPALEAYANSAEADGYLDLARDLREIIENRKLP